MRLPHIPRPNMKVCILADQVHKDQADALGIDAKTVDDLKKLNKNKKLVKKLGMNGIFCFQLLILFSHELRHLLVL